MYKPEYNGFPPVHLNLSLYQDLLKNFPFGSGEEYQAFLNATTSQSQSTTVNSSAANQSPSNQDPLSSTFTNSAAGRPKSFWRNLSFSRKSYKVNPPTRRAQATQKETCSIQMNPLNSVFKERTNFGSKKANGTATNGTINPPPALPTSLVNEHAQIPAVDDLNLEEIRIDDDDGNVVVHNAL